MEQETTLGAVAESQQNISGQPTQPSTPVVEQQPAQPVQPVQQAETVQTEQATATWTSSWGAEQTAQTVEAPQSPVDNLLNQVNATINENKTLESVAQETEQTQLQKENEDALNAIIKEQTKDLPSEPTEVKTEETSNQEESDRLDEELKQGLEDIKDKKSAEDMAKKVYLAFQKERSMHQFDKEQDANTISVLKWMVKKLNEQVASTDNDPRVTKLSDEMYTLNKLEQAYSKDKSEVSRKNLTRYYVAKLATLNPVMNANKIMDIFDWGVAKSNTMWASIPAAAPVAEVKKEVQRPMWIPASKRGMY